MHRRTALATAGGAILGGCLNLTSEPDDQPESGESGANEEGDQANDDGDEGEEVDDVSDVELREILDVGSPPDAKFSASVVSDETFVGTVDLGERVARMDLSGEIVWTSDEIEADYAFGRNFATDEQRAYVWFVRDDATHLRAFDADDGAERWTHVVAEADEHFEVDEVVAGTDGVFYTVSKDVQDRDERRPTARAIGPDGDVRWDVTVREGGFNRGLAHYGDAVYVALSRETIRLDAADGDVLDEYEIGASHNGITRDGPVGYVDTGGGITTLDLAEGSTVWERETDRDLDTGPVIAGDKLLVGNDAGWVDAYATSDGSHRWETRLDCCIENGRQRRG